jgi:CubicO group peptidase (beta-lactamase class C family)
MALDNILPRSSPEAEGVSSKGLLGFLDAVDESVHDLHSFMLLRHGRVVAEGWWSPYAPELPHMLFSLSKSFVSTAIGLAIAEGRLSVDDNVVSLLPNDCPTNVSEPLASLCVRHLLTMTAGHDPETFGLMVSQPEGNWVKGYFNRPMPHRPGTHFAYDNCSPYVLSAIVQQVTGMPVLDYLQQRLFKPLGIINATWTTCPRGINIGWSGLSLTTEEIARFGQLYLQKGIWQERQLLPKTWIEEATRRQVSNGDNPEVDEEQGYGYLFWRIRHGAYRGDGAFGQFCEIWPDQDAVLAITGGKPGMEIIQDLVWEHVFPAVSTTALEEDTQAEQALNRKLTELTIAPVNGQPDSPVARRLSKQIFDLNYQGEEKLWFDFGNGRFGATIVSISFDFGPEGCTCTIRDDRNVHEVACGNGYWRSSVTTASSQDGKSDQPVAASGAWTADDTYEMQWCFVETASRSTLTCHFVEDTITIDWEENATFADQKHPQLRGQAMPDKASTRRGE